MPVHAVIPFKPQNPKTRLSSVLNRSERERFAEAMLQDVIQAVLDGGCEPTLLVTHPFRGYAGVPVIVDPGDLNEALNRLFQTATAPLLVIMSDLPLATAESVRRLIASPADIAFVPGRGGGTNAIFVRRPQRFRADFYGASFMKHRKIAEDTGATYDVVDSFRLHTDVDEEEDLVEVLIHGGGMARRFLEDSGFSLRIENGRVGVQRNPHE
ncbi:MAG: 2-phospho-L-lactate guanylyltransferase [Methanomicrobiales archaeon]|nr:2-phospho-L-lactate guanylyltransferase [Methanomicrobiales archaeon]MDI6875385.1 2-phospho-L-lactate guanylyltransferase [Methanomicrobiales archaeon]